MIPFAGWAATGTKFEKNADKAIPLLGAQMKLSDTGKGVNKVSLESNALVAAVEGGKKSDVKAAIGNDKPIVSITAAKEFLAKGDKGALKDFMKETGATIGKKGGSADQVKSLQNQANGTRRTVGKNNASITAGAANNSATVILNDKRMTNFMRAIGQPVKGF